MSSELYRIPAKPVTYKGQAMRSMLEMETARALDQVGVAWQYEKTRFADDEGCYTPDFYVPSIEILGAGAYNISELYIEARPTMATPGFRRKAERNAAALAVSTDAPLIFVGLKECLAALLGWCYGVAPEPVLGVIGVRRHVRLDGNFDPPAPCLYLGDFAASWIDGYSMRAS